MSREDRPPDLDTLAIHAGRPRDAEGAVVTPIYQSSTFDYPAGNRELVYTRYGNNPTQIALQERLAALEGSEAALVLASGMGALSTAILTVCGSGDHLVAAPSLYGGTHRLLDVELPRLGIQVTYVDGIEAEAWRAAVRPETKLILWEAISNPLLRVPDTPTLAALARERGCVSLVDATFATPINLRPIDHGVDLVMHSATKYLGGHSDLIGGVLAGSGERIAEATHRMHSFGASIDPHAAFLIERGVKTLAVRMKRHNENGRRVAEFLAGHERVARTHYPGLPDHPDHAVAGRILSGSGGVVTFVPDAGYEATCRLVTRFRWIRQAPSLGGVESLVSLPALTSHRGLSREDREALGIPDPTIRLALGIEAADDLVDDLDRALASL
jgi:cystathionine gamma-synthase/cystathionine gamma-lyase/cystathionine beta-lyase